MREQGEKQRDQLPIYQNDYDESCQCLDPKSSSEDAEKWPDPECYCEDRAVRVS